LRPLRVSAYLAAVICVLILLSGAARDAGSGPLPVLVAAGLLSASVVLALLLSRTSRAGDRLAAVWLSILVVAGVQILGGAGGPAFPVYFLLLTWMAMPGIRGPAMETGFGIGVVEALSMLVGGSGLLRGSFEAEALMENLLPALGAFLPPALFGAAAEWMVESFYIPGTLEDTVDSQPRGGPSFPDHPGFPLETARNLLPMLHRRSGAFASCLFTVHDGESYLLNDYLGGGGRIADRSLVPASHWLFRKVSESWDCMTEDLEGVSGDRQLPHYLDPPVTKHVLACPVREGEELRAFFLLESDDGPFQSSAVEDLRDAVGVVTTAAGESCEDPLAASPGGSWFSSLLVQTAASRELRQIFHVAVRHLHSLVEGSTVTVAVMDDQEDGIRVYESYGRFSGRRSGRSFPLGSGVAGWVINYRKMIVRNRMRIGDKAVRSFSEADDPEREVGSCCAVPILANDRVTGLLLLERGEDDGFGRDHAYILQGVSGLLTIALERLLLEVTGKDAVGRDGITGLMTITDFYEGLLETVKDVRRYGRSIAILEVDLDEFGSFNLEHGYRLGDRVLKAAAKRLTSLLGSDVPVARVGGDSFGVCIPGADRPAAEAVAEKIASSFAGDPLCVEGKAVAVTVSVGGCCSHTDKKIARLPLEASRALQAVRRDGKGRCRVVELGAFELE
jgi:diguanylate cyclase (GGDEF)-like protein